MGRIIFAFVKHFSVIFFLNLIWAFLIYELFTIWGSFNSSQIFPLRKIIKGGADKSYGVHVAEMAGLPNKVIVRAHSLLQKLMKDKIDGVDKKTDTIQLEIFEKQNQELINDLNALDIDNLTPVEALTKLSELKNKYE